VVVQVHPEASALTSLKAPEYKRIAIALEFGKKDDIIISHALGQASKNAVFILVHVVESASAKIYGGESDDLETRKDHEHINIYVQRLKEMGYEAIGVLGFNNRAKEIVRLVNENRADMLVIGGHGHTGIKDWFYGETIDAVRHELKMPVLVVNV